MLNMKLFRAFVSSFIRINGNSNIKNKCKLNKNETINLFATNKVNE